MRRPHQCNNILRPGPRATTITRGCTPDVWRGSRGATHLVSLALRRTEALQRETERPDRHRARPGIPYRSRSPSAAFTPARARPARRGRCRGLGATICSRERARIVVRPTQQGTVVVLTRKEAIPGAHSYPRGAVENHPSAPCQLLHLRHRARPHRVRRVEPSKLRIEMVATASAHNGIATSAQQQLMVSVDAEYVAGPHD